jgi:hypothetical protein
MEGESSGESDTDNVPALVDGQRQMPDEIPVGVPERNTSAQDVARLSGIRTKAMPLASPAEKTPLGLLQSNIPPQGFSKHAEIITKRVPVVSRPPPRQGILARLARQLLRYRTRCGSEPRAAKAGRKLLAPP